MCIKSHPPILLFHAATKIEEKYKLKRGGSEQQLPGTSAAQCSMLAQAPNLTCHVGAKRGWGHPAPAQSTGIGLSLTLIASQGPTERMFFLAWLLFLCSSLWIALLMLSVPTSPEPWAGPASAPPGWATLCQLVLLLYCCRLSLLKAFGPELIFKYLIALSIVKTGMKTISLLQ